jgi:hypothetical protein
MIYILTSPVGFSRTYIFEIGNPRGYFIPLDTLTYIVEIGANLLCILRTHLLSLLRMAE